MLLSSLVLALAATVSALPQLQATAAVTPRTAPRFTTSKSMLKADSYRFKEAVVYAPLVNDSTKFPLLVFGHGLGADVKFYSAIMSSVASQGYIVVAPTSCTIESQFCPDFYLDLISVFQFTKDIHTSTSANKSSALVNMIDFTMGTGIYGHSMGSLATYKSSTKEFAQAFNITGVVPLHPGLQVHELFGQIVDSPVPASPTGKEPAVPILIVTGDKDDTLSAASAKELYRITQSKSKAFISIKGAEHTEPADVASSKRVEEGIVGAFFNCFIKGKGCRDRFSGGGKVCGLLPEGDVAECIDELA